MSTGTSEGAGLAQVEQRLLAVFAERLHLDVPSADTELLDTGLVDSLMLVELLAHLEEEFGLTVTAEDLEIENFRSVERIARLVAARRGAVTNR